VEEAGGEVHRAPLQLVAAHAQLRLARRERRLQRRLQAGGHPGARREEVGAVEEHPDAVALPAHQLHPHRLRAELEVEQRIEDDGGARGGGGEQRAEAALEVRGGGAGRHVAEEVAAEHLVAVQAREARLGEVVAQHRAGAVQAEGAVGQQVQLLVTPRVQRARVLRVGRGRGAARVGGGGREAGGGGGRGGARRWRAGRRDGARRDGGRGLQAPDGRLGGAAGRGARGPGRRARRPRRGCSRAQRRSGEVRGGRGVRRALGGRGQEVDDGRRDGKGHGGAHLGPPSRAGRCGAKQ
jgi:hypothetical protein